MNEQFAGLDEVIEDSLMEKALSTPKQGQFSRGMI